MSLIPNLAIVALGGAIGSCLRYSIGLVETFNTAKAAQHILSQCAGLLYYRLLVLDFPKMGCSRTFAAAAGIFATSKLQQQ